MLRPVQLWLLAEHRRRNLQTLDSSIPFTAHRQQVMRLLSQAAGSTPGKLCVLGAGNCNDLSLSELCASFREIELVDIDQAAVETAVASAVSDTLRSQFHVADSTDITGVFGQLHQRETSDKTMDDLRALKESLAAEPPEIPNSPFDCILSSCLLSQLIDSVYLAIGANHPSLIDVIFLLRKQHLKQLTQSLVPGGRGLLVFDFVSNHTLPNLMQIEEISLNQALLEAIEARNFFTSLNPFAILRELQNDPYFVQFLTDVRLFAPWRWDIGKKQFAVAAVSFVRR